jgi:cystathionine beta-synthase
VTWLIGSTSTGGTLCGTGRYLREQNPCVKIIAVDAYGSVLKKYHETGIYDPGEIGVSRIEGTGKNFIPGNVDFEIIDRFIKVTDKDSALRTRELARKEGILAGYSSGAVLQCLREIKDQLSASDTVVLLFADHGSKYVSKVFDDDWMRAQGFPVEEGEPLSTFSSCFPAKP